MAASVAVAPALAAAPAQADDPGLVLSVPPEADLWQYPASQLPQTTVLPFQYGTDSAAGLKNYRLVIDTAGTARLDTASWRPFDGDCVTAGTQYSCTVPSSKVSHAYGTLTLTAQPQVPVGATGTVHITESADGLPTRTADIQVRITDGSPELDLSPLSDGVHSTEAQPGSGLPESLTVTNVGPLPTDRIVVELTIMHGLALPDSFTNCEYARFPKDTPPATDAPDEQDVICTIDQTVQSGESYRVDLGSLDVGQDALDPWMDVAIGTAEDDTADTWRSRSEFRPGSGSALTATKVDRPDSSRVRTGPKGKLKVLANTDTTFKLAASWKPTDDTGLHGTLSVAFENPGPGSFLETAETITFTFPLGSKVLRLPPFCEAGPHGGDESVALPEYVFCTRPKQWVPKGFRETFEVDVELPDGAQGAPLELTTFWSTSDQTPWRSQTTKTTVVLGDAAPSAGPTPSATDTTATVSAATAGVRDSAPKTPLASTGASGTGTLTALALGLGAVALGGGVLYLTTRRRRSGTHQ